MNDRASRSPMTTRAPEGVEHGSFSRDLVGPLATGTVDANPSDGLIHILLLVAVVVMLIRVVQGRWIA